MRLSVGADESDWAGSDSTRTSEAGLLSGGRIHPPRQTGHGALILVLNLQHEMRALGIFLHGPGSEML